MCVLVGSAPRCEPGRGHGSAQTPSASLRTCREKISSHPSAKSLSVISLCDKTSSPSAEQVSNLLLRRCSHSLRVLALPLRNTFLIKDQLNKSNRASVKHSLSALPQMSKPECMYGTGCQQFSFVREQNMVMPKGTSVLPLGFCTNFKKI